jgi:uncharacterized membrane protein YdfJ with MMPL/SSD domain
MRPAAIVGIVLIVLGIVSLFVGIPTREKHGVKLGDAEVGVETKSTKAVPVAVSALLIVGGVAAVVAGSRKG